MPDAAASKAPGTPAAQRRRRPEWSMLPREHRLPVAVLAVLAAVLLRDFLFGGRVFFQRDIQLMWYTQVEALVRSVSAGALPTWNPYMGFGQPLWADANNQVLYPSTWLHLLMRPWTYYTLFAFVHVVIAGLGMFTLGRDLSLSRHASLAAAALWILSGPFLSVVCMWNQLAGAALMPWVVRAAGRALDTWRLSSAALWGGLLALQILAGSPETALMAGLLSAGWGLKAVRWRKPLHPSHRGLFLALLVGLLTALGLSAGQWLPAVEVAAGSIRRDLAAEARLYWSVHPGLVVQTLLPMPLNELQFQPMARQILFEGRIPLFASLYLGLPSITLVGAALLAPNRRLAWFLAGAAAAACVMMLGRYTPAYEWVSWLVLPMRSLRYPVKASLAIAFCWSLLAGLGLDAWLRVEHPRRWRLLVVASAGLATAIGCLALAACTVWADVWAARLLADPAGRLSVQELLAPAARRLLPSTAAAFLTLLAALAAWRWRAAIRAGAIIAIAGATADLATTHDRINLRAPKELYTVRPPVLEHIRGRELPRVYAYDYSFPGKSQEYLRRDAAAGISGIPEGWPLPAAKALALRSYLCPPTSGAWGLYGSYDQDVAGLASAEFWRVAQALRVVEGTPRHKRLLQAGAVTHVLALHTEGFEDLELLAAQRGLFPEPVRIFGVPNTRPRSYAVSGSRLATGEEALRLLVEPAGFELEREVLLATGRASAPEPAFRGGSRVVAYGYDEVRLDVDLSHPGFVVLVDAFDPGWKATVDGRPGTVLRANLLFRAIDVPAGRHEIVYRYRPAGVAQGLAVTGLALAGFLALAAIGRRRRRSDAARPA